MTKIKKTAEPTHDLVDYVIDGHTITFYGAMKLGTLHAVLATLQKSYPEMIGFDVHIKPIKPRGLHGRSMTI